MTERFSPEYRAFILSDEASVLQEYIVLGRGVWIGIVREGHETVEVRNLGEDFEAALYRFMSDITGAITKWVWLPTLSDLLGMIEEAGWEWRRSGENIIGWPRKHPGRVQIIDNRDLLLAAATLAARALEDK